MYIYVATIADGLVWSMFSYRRILGHVCPLAASALVVSMTSPSTMVDSPSTMTIRSIDYISVPVASILTSLTISGDNITIAIQLLRNIVGASMESIRLLTMMPDYTGTIAIEDDDIPSMVRMLK